MSNPINSIQGNFILRLSAILFLLYIPIGPLSQGIKDGMGSKFKKCEFLLLFPRGKSILYPIRAKSLRN
jgi:hypothetical protein